MSSEPLSFGSYTTYAVLGQGGRGIVYAARDPQGVEVALKALLSGKGAAEAERVRMGREVQTLRRLDHHGLVRVLDAGEERGVPWFAMERLKGESLEALLRTQGSLPESAALELGIQLCEALSVAHAEGVLHRDLKPDNVVRVGGDRYVLIDFGLTKDLSLEASAQLSRTGALQGTPGYWAPEQAAGQGKRATVQTDVYGVGALLYGATTGHPPINAASLLEAVVATLEQVPEAPSSFAPLSPGFDALVLRCLEKAPERRFATLSELAGALRAIRSGSHAVGPPPEATSRRKPVAWLLALVALGMIGGGGLLVEHKVRVESAARLAASTAASAELSAFLEPGGGSRRFAELTENLPRWRAALRGSERPELQLAEGLAAIARQDKSAAEQALAHLREAAAGEQARLLRAAVHARWSTEPDELRRARSTLRTRLREEDAESVGLVDFRLLAGRAELLGGFPLRAIAEFRRMRSELGEGPWQSRPLPAADEATLRLFEALFDSGWGTERELGLLARACGVGGHVGRTADALLSKVTRGGPPDQRRFWDLWVTQRNCRTPPIIMKSPFKGDEVVYPNFVEKVEWFESLSSESLAQLKSHEGIDLLLRDLPRFRRELLRSLAWAAAWSGRFLESVEHLRTLAKGLAGESEVYVDLCIVLRDAASHASVPKGAQAEFREELVELLPRALTVATTSRGVLAQLAWTHRLRFSTPEAALRVARSLDSKGEGVRQAWFYVAAGRRKPVEGALRRGLRELGPGGRGRSVLAALLEGGPAGFTLKAIERAYKAHQIVIAAPILAPR